MNVPEDTLDTLVRDHLQRELEPQLGRAEACFSRELSRQRGNHPSQTARLLIWGLWAAGAIAASVGIVWGVGVYRNAPRIQITQEKPAQIVRSSKPVAPSVAVPMQEVVAYRTLDEGSVFLKDHGPARQLRRQVLQTVQWYDPQRKANFQITVPREQVVLVGMPSY